MYQSFEGNCKTSSSEDTSSSDYVGSQFVLTFAEENRKKNKFSPESIAWASLERYIKERIP
jgi:hypothetical protein